ncbi:MAG: calcium-binding protein [Sphingomonadales bacterium]|nr:MAG: calcium-binding protein [Sphingomonadales bacterium]
MAAKIFIASRDVFSSGKHHSYLVYDGDGNLSTANDQEVIRGGPSFLIGGKILIEAGMPMAQSEDDSQAHGDRNFTEIVSANANTVWSSMKSNAEALGANIGDNYRLTTIDYAAEGVNSNSVIATILYRTGLNMFQHLPREGGTGDVMRPSTFPGAQGLIGTSGDDTWNVTPEFFNRIIADQGGSDTYVLDGDSLINSKGVLVIREQSGIGDDDVIVLDGVDPSDVSVVRSQTGELVVMVQGRIVAWVPEQFNEGSDAKVNEVVVQPEDGPPVSIPVDNPQDVPLFKPNSCPLGSWVPGVLGGFEDGENSPSPLVLDLDGNGIELAALNGTGSVYWDVDVDGMAEATGWIANGDGLLVIDTNADGVINDHSELFGDQTGYANGFFALSAYDSNASGTITNGDSQWGNLRVWVDANADGYSQTTELHTLASLGITSINLGYSTVSYFVAGNEIKQESTFTMNGQTRTIADAWFAVDQVNSVHNENYTLDVQTLFMPTLRGYGDLPDLHIAMSLDEDLLDMVQAFVTGASLADMAEIAVKPFEGAIQDIMFKWAGVENVDPGSRGGVVDARLLGFLEAFTANDFSQVGIGGTPDPTGPVAMEHLRGAWANAYQAIAARLIYQAQNLNEIFAGEAPYDPYTDTFGQAATLDIDAIEDRILSCDGWSEKFNLSRLLVSLVDEVIGIGNLSQQDHDAFQALMPNGVTIEALAHIIIGDATISGDASDSLIIGDSGVEIVSIDTAYGYGGNDILLGNDDLDYLYGGTGNDTYVFNPGDGYNFNENNPDQIIENLNEGTDKVIFGEGITVTNIYAWTDTSGGLTINYDGDYDLITIVGGIAGGGTQYASTVGSYTEQVIFNDGTTWNLTAGLTIRNNDIGRSLYGSNYADTIEGGSELDTFVGYNGNDTYVFKAGDGYNAYNTEMVYEATGGGTDKIKFEAGINPNDIYMWTDYTGNLTIKYGTDDLLTIGGSVVGGGTAYASKVGQHLEQIVFADNSTWSLTSGLHLRNDDNGRSMYGTNSADTIEGGAASDTLYGYNGNDVLYGGAGGDSLTGGAGADRFAWKVADIASYTSDTITDYSKSGGDKLDISDLLDGAGYDPLTDALSDFVRFTEVGSNTMMNVDTTGSASFSTANEILILSGVTNILAGGSGSVSTATDLTNLINSGNLVV